MKNKYEQNIKLDKINSLTLITSESCNLRCKYCEISKSINPETHALITKKIKESFINGEFLKNIKSIFKEYQINKEKIESVEFWGQEPTLTLDAVEEFFPEFYKLIPNCNRLFFSTNGVAYPEKIISFIKMLDRTIINKKFEIRIQFSYDGEYETRKLRGIEPNIILSNIEYIIKELNNLTLNNINIRLDFHNVISMDLIKRLNKNDKSLINYFTELNQLAQKFYFLNTNEKVDVNHYFGSGLQTPYNATKEEGQMLADFAKKCLTLEQYNQIVAQFLNIQNFLQNLMEKFSMEEIINNILYKNIIDENFAKELGHLTNCGYGIYSLKIRYDGSTIHCQNAIFGLEDDNSLNNYDLKHQIQKNLIEKKYYPNLLNDNKENINKFFYRANSLNLGFCFEYSEIVNMMILMLKCHQIDESYSDINKLLYHGFLLTTIFSCPDTKIMNTSSAFGREGGLIRYFCNGFMDIIEKEYEKKGVFFN